VSRAASGIKAWVIQRVTATYIGLFGIYLVVHFIVAPPANHGAFRAWVAQPVVSLGLLLFIPAVLSHAWVGFRDVLMDYARPIVIRASALAVMAFILTASGLWATQALLLARMG
jgi:succinate dehydrogenase / fumarate reductase membrane anchor subunit